MDDKTNRGPIDRAFVARNQAYEVRFFVDQYLKDGNFDLTERNREILHGEIMAYKPTPPSHMVNRAALKFHLDRKFKKPR